MFFIAAILYSLLLLCYNLNYKVGYFISMRDLFTT